MPGAETASGASSNGAAMPEANVQSSLTSDPPEHSHHPHHHDHHRQQKMPQAGMHGVGMAAAAGKIGGMLHDCKRTDVFEFSCSSSPFCPHLLGTYCVCRRFRTVSRVF